MKMIRIYFLLLIFIVSYNLNSKDYSYRIDLEKINYFEEINQGNFKIKKSNLFFNQNLFDTKIIFHFAVSENSEIKIKTKKTENLPLKSNPSEKISNAKFFNIVDLGIYRGFNIKKVEINPFYYNPLTNEVEVSYFADFEVNNKLKKNDIKLNINNYQFLDNINEITRLPKSKSQNKFQSNALLDENINYLKIETTEDKIYKIGFDEILRYLPELNDKETKYLKLINRNNLEPIYILSADNNISNDDYLLFKGKHRRGDSTYYNFYGTEEPYFLYYDDSEQGNFYDLSDINGDFPQIKEVQSKIHYEKDSIYFFFNHSSEQYPNEGWYWGEVYPDEPYNNKSLFEKPLFISPSNNLDNNITLRAHYKTYFDTITVIPYLLRHTYDLELQVNDYKYERNTFEGYRFDYLDSEINPDKLINGLNFIGIKSYAQNEQTDNYTGINYIEIEGLFNPQAINHKLNFSTNSDGIKNFKIPNFLNNETVAIDLKNKKIIFPEMISGYNFNIGILKSENHSLSLGINNDYLISQDPGIFLIYRQNGELHKKHFEEFNQELADNLNSINDNTPFSFAITNNLKIPNNIKNILAKIGAENITNHSAGQIYSLFGIKANDRIYEEIQNINLNNHVFIEHENSDYAQADFNIETTKSEVFISNTANADDYKLSNVNKSPASENQIDFLIITHNKFEKEIKRLAEYRKNKSDLNYQIIDADDIYNHFDYGIKSPFAIKNFLKYAYNNYPSPKPSYVLLVGDATWDPRYNMKSSKSINYIPTYGMPVSDFWYTLIDGDDLTPDISIGRFPVNTIDELNNMIDKIITYETSELKSWMKEMLFLSGGTNPDEIRRFAIRIPFVKEDILEAEPFGGKGTSIIQDKDNPSSQLNAGEIRNEINEGKFWVNFLGHASSEIFDMDGWEVDKLSNKNRYGILTTLSCNTGAFAEPSILSSRNETYVKAKDKGFTGTISGTTTGSVQHQWHYFSKLVESFATKEVNFRHLGDINNYAKIKTANNDDPFNVMTRYHMTLLGDPTATLNISKKTDLFIDPNEIIITNDEGNNLFSEDDENINISGFINNNGFCSDNSYKVTIIREIEENGFSDTLIIDYPPLCFRDSLNVSIPVMNKPGTHRIKIIVDNEKVIDDSNFENNYYEKNVSVLSKGLIVIEPNNYGNIDLNNPHFRFINPVISSSDIEYKFLITDDINSQNILYRATDDEIIEKENYVDWIPAGLSIESNKSYWLKAGYNLNGKEGKWIWINFYGSSDFSSDYTLWKNNHKKQFSQSLITESIQIEQDDYSKITLKSDTIDYNILSHIGDYQNENPIKSWVDIQVGNNVYVSSEFAIGFNLVTIPADISKGKGTYKRFDTWGNDNSYKEEFWLDSSAVYLVDYLQDSIQKNEYLFLSTCRPSFRLQIMHQTQLDSSRGNLDTLIYYLKKYGASKADDLLNDLDSTMEATYLLISRKGYEDPIEKLIFTRDSLISNNSILRHNFEGNFSTKLIGPAKKWNKLNIKGNQNNEFHSANISIFGVDNFGNETLIKEINSINEIDISDISAEDYPYLYLDVDLKINKISFNSFDNIEKPFISEIYFEYVPVPEIAVLKNNFSISNENPLLGENQTFDFSFENISLRSDAENITFNIQGKKNQGELFTEKNINFDKIRKNEIIDSSYTFKALDIDNNNSLEGQIIKGINNDIYIFNNKESVNFKRAYDTLKPSIQIKIDGKYVQNEDYISSKPVIEIELYDNTQLNIEDSSSISARLNGYYYPNENAKISDFQSINDGNLKAVYTFSPDTIRYEDILLYAYVKDPEGNRDTLKLNLNTSLINSDIINENAFPNPFEKDTEIRFTYATPDKSHNATLSIFNYSGQIIRKINTEINPGNNSIKWDGKDKYFKKVPVGLYFWRLDVNEKIYVPTKSGKIIKMK